MTDRHFMALQKLERAITANQFYRTTNNGSVTAAVNITDSRLALDAAIIEARDALATAAQETAGDWVMVPREPTEEMVESMARAFDADWNPLRASQARYEWAVYDRSKGAAEEDSSRLWRDARVAAMRAAYRDMIAAQETAGDWVMVPRRFIPW